MGKRKSDRQTIDIKKEQIITPTRVLIHSKNKNRNKKTNMPQQKKQQQTIFLKPYEHIHRIK